MGPSSRSWESVVGRGGVRKLVRTRLHERVTTGGGLVWAIYGTSGIIDIAMTEV